MLSLAEEVEMLRAEVHQLKDAIAVKRVPAYQHVIGLKSSYLQEMFNLLLRHEYVTREVFFQSVYGHRTNPPEPKIADVMMCHLRKRCREHDIEIETIRNIGWRMTPESKDRVRELCR